MNMSNIINMSKKAKRKLKECVYPNSSREFLLKSMSIGSICGEIGVYKGEFSSQILKIVKPTKLHLIDPWKYNQSVEYKDSLYGGDQGIDQSNMDTIFENVLDLFSKEIKTGHVVIHRNTSADACIDFQDNYFDWIYIDGDHRYDSVLKDLRMYIRKVKIGGFIAGDDYDIDGWWGNDIKRAVKEFVGENNVELVEIKDGQFLMKRLY